MKKIKTYLKLLLCVSLLLGFTTQQVSAKNRGRSGNDPVAVRLSGSGTINIYKDDSLSGTALSYITGSNTYGGEVAFLEESSNAYKIRVAGLTGWIKKGSGLSLLSYDELKSPSFYKLNDYDEIYHRISSNPINNTYLSTLILGPNPGFMEKGVTYFSYDGNYFYTDYGVMVEDYMNDTFENAENADEPYYNYYQYLPLHTQSNIGGRKLDSYIENNLGYTSIPSSYSGKKNNQSMLYETGDSFFSVQDIYGTNAMVMFGIAMNESAGVSQYAIERNNLFGLGAFDADPNKASSFDSIEKGIESFASVHMNWGFLDYNDWRYNGGHVGDKNSGINVRYASDPYWGEKAASYYYKADKANGLVDYGTYEIALRRNSAKMDIKKDANTSSKTIGSVSTISNLPYVVLEEDGRYYKVLLDFHVDADRNILKHDASLWFEPFDTDNNYGYIAKSDVDIVTAGNISQGGVDDSKELSFTDSALRKAINAALSSSRAADQVITTKEGLSLKTLKIDDSNLSSLEGISQLKALEEIELVNVKNNADLSELENCKKLSVVNVHIHSTNQWTLIDSIDTKLDLMITTSLKDLPDLTHFNSLTVNGGSISDASIFADYASKSVTLSNQKITVQVKNEGDYSLINNPLIDSRGKSVDLSEAEVTCDDKVCDFTYDHSTGQLKVKAKGASKIVVSFDVKLSGAVGVFNGQLSLNNVTADLSKNGWQQSGGEWLYVDNGKLVTGWLQVNNIWYLFKDNGVMARGWAADKAGAWYFLDYSNGSMLTGWRANGKTWYYLNPANGIMQTNWITIGSSKYYLGKDGAMRTGNQKIDGVMYAFNDSGVYLEGVTPPDNGETEEPEKPVTPENPVDPETPVDPEKPMDPETPVDPEKPVDPETPVEPSKPNQDLNGTWKLENSKYTYVLSDESLFKGWLGEKGCWYLLDYNTGEMRTGWIADGKSWYYMNPANGIMQTGWIKVDGADYYCNQSGIMATGSQTIDGKSYTFNASGILQ